ncbi:ATP-binding protein [Streptomyces sp. TRM 70351]|uniref:ATP-binding protein n=1 Tax=Streptomyces sp. TRM 70351 TaxID=3116552 RepID=UPI002E7BCA97|nr:ATP-binding protein [Streptomyces sp. TRM 70351]MEE1930995.1 ATP-binding protein [Streptomyces sp. TRM 70351]
MNGEITQTESPAPEHRFGVLLSPTRRGARLARLLTVAHLWAWGLPSDRAAHVVAELAANAVQHGRVPGRNFRLDLAVRCDVLRIEVTDTRGDRLFETVARRPVCDGAESGRGLLLVAVMADRWGVAEGPVPRKTVWAELDLPR